MVDSWCFKCLLPLIPSVQMRSSPTDSSDESSDLIVEIIETLEACGLENDTYQLHDYVDVDALEKLLASWQHHDPIHC